MNGRAPGSSRTNDAPLALELMNTVWIEKGVVRDALDTREAVDAWLTAARTRLGRTERPARRRADGAAADLRALRDALRRVAADLTDDPRTLPVAPGRAEAVATINAISTRAPRVPVLVDAARAWTVEERFPAVDGDTDEAVLALVAGQGIGLFAGPQSSLLWPCLGPGCLRYFLRADARRVWCSPHCGNRARVTRHYYRHRT